MQKIINLIITLIFIFFPVFLYAKDVKVKGYYRKDGTYVRPHIRSSPDSIKSNNYGPSKRSSELMNPRSRDYDGDGIPNYLDSDSDNDGILDDVDSNPYGRNRSNYSIKKYKPYKSNTNKNKSSTTDNKDLSTSSELQPKKPFPVYFKNGRKLSCDKVWESKNTIYLVVHNKQFAIGYDKNEIDMRKTFDMAD